jgi:acetyl-CoA carboxylase biotin carboxylase subunit
MIGKFIAFGDTREQALARMRVALRETVVDGIDTNLPLHRDLFADPVFCLGGAGIHHLESWIASRQAARH